jgi:hypothetical protein
MTALLASWAIALGADSPVLTVPWHDKDGNVAYVDLKSHPERIDNIPEARENPVLADVLATLNAPESPWVTAKCDRWELDEDDLETAALDLELALAQAGIGSYIDFYHRDARLFASLEHHRDLLQRLTLAEGIGGGNPKAILELTLRRCIAVGAEGYAITAFLYAIGDDAAQAQANWADALTALTRILLDTASAGGDRMKDAGE